MWCLVLQAFSPDSTGLVIPSWRTKNLLGETGSQLMRTSLLMNSKNACSVSAACFRAQLISFHGVHRCASATRALVLMLTIFEPGGGLWHPEAQALAALRRDIDQNPRRLKEVLMGEDIREELLKGAPRKLEKVVQAFVSSTTNAETALKTKPRVSKRRSCSTAPVKLLLRRFFVANYVLRDGLITYTPRWQEIVLTKAEMKP